jgi:hypothetical protein
MIEILHLIKCGKLKENIAKKVKNID